MLDALKYKVNINLRNKNNSHTCIISYVKENSRVLDIGCACGDLGRYLHDHMNCEVFGVDCDEQSINVAKATGAYKRILNIDISALSNELDTLKEYFDFIILGDVLEHLRNPEETLVKLSDLLKSDGVLIISLPNIAHGSVKINLLRNKFNYTQTGLLDHTHMRFFTKESISKLFEVTQLRIEKVEEVTAPFEGTPENANTKDLPKKILQFIENDMESHVYQYIIKASKKTDNDVIHNHYQRPSPQQLSKITLSKRILKNKIVTFKKRVKTFDERFLFSTIAKTKLKFVSSGRGVNYNILQDYASSVLDIPNGPADHYEEYTKNDFVVNDKGINLIAFYLPQFHPIHENDLWWGKGFTEWTNVTKAVPQFLGHYQPRLPSDLGFYDLRLPEIQRQQIALAKNYGIKGFCFHYYWFSGKRLLEKPIFQFLSNKEKDFDFPFCLCWANENWTRRWDASENQVLMPQKHEKEDDLFFIKDVEPFLQDPRYIKVGGRNLLIVYRIHLFPKDDVIRMIDVWRKYCKEKGLGDLYLVAAQTHGFIEDPRSWGFDAAVEFPPHNFNLPIINSKMYIVNQNFAGFIYDFQKYFQDKPYLDKTPFVLFKTVFPEWDNTPRMINRGHIFYGAGKDTYRRWLTDAIHFTSENYAGDERIIFINAWNEWAEGAYIEPDRKNGYSYLQITYDCLKNS